MFLTLAIAGHNILFPIYWSYCNVSLLCIFVFIVENLRPNSLTLFRNKVIFYCRVLARLSSERIIDLVKGIFS